MGCLAQFIVLIWKNFLLQKRRPIATVFEILVPVILSFVLVSIRDQIPWEVSNGTQFQSRTIASLPSFHSKDLSPSHEMTIIYLPGNEPLVYRIMEATKDYLNLKRKPDHVEYICKFDLRDVIGEERDPFIDELFNTGPVTDEISNNTDLNKFFDIDGNPIFGRRFSRSIFNSSDQFSSFSGFVSETPVFYHDNYTVYSSFGVKNGSFAHNFSFSINNISVPITLFNITSGGSLYSSTYSNSGESARPTLNETAAATYEQLPYSMQQVVDGIALERNLSVATFLVEVLENGYMSQTSKEPSENNWDKTIRCIAGQLREDPKNFTLVLELLEKRYAEVFIYSTPYVKLMAIENEALLQEYLQNVSNYQSLLAAVTFDGISKQSSEVPDNLKITFRFRSEPLSPVAKERKPSDLWKTSKRFSGFAKPGPRSENPKSLDPYYDDEGFLALIHGVQMGIASVLTNTAHEDNLALVGKFPSPPSRDDPFLHSIQNLLPMMAMLSFFYTALVIVRSLVQERESRMKEYMMMMGLSNWLLWLSWFCKYLLFLAISCSFIVVVYKLNTDNGSVLEHSDEYLLLTFLIIYAAATINFSFLISVFFRKATVGAGAAGIIFACSYVPYFYVSIYFDDLTLSTKLTALLLSNVAMAAGFNVVGRFESKGEGSQWSNLNKPPSFDEDFTLQHVFAMLILDAILYMVLAVYIEGVFPGEHGISKPWNFPFTVSYWRGVKSMKSTDNLQRNIEDGETDNREFFETEPASLKCMVKIKGLRKVFKNRGKVNIAVDGLNLNMYEGQITVLLGHNGAGKTTTMSMLTGFFSPSGGDAFVNGHSIRKDISGVRKSMGLCPQFDILFDVLTVDEHLNFFGRLKGLSAQKAKDECKKIKDLLKLSDKSSAKACTLSGGMKRKLSVGIALCAGSKYVILDEPTSGMDPAARRALWDALQHHKSKCTMLLSTHFMDEADVLGDRIAIMAKGKLRCVGSSVFLKKKFGVGYHIVCIKEPNCDLTAISKLMQSYIPETQVDRSSGAEVSFLLPFHASSRFPQLFQALDKQAKSLGISGYGAVVTTLEEVFLRVTEDASEDLKSVSQKAFPTIAATNNARTGNSGDKNALQLANMQKDFLSSSYQLNKGIILWLQQFYSLIIKKILHSMRNYKVAAAQLLVPVFFTFLSVLGLKASEWKPPSIPLDLALDVYGPTNVYVHSFTNSSFDHDYAAQFNGTLAKVILHDQAPVNISDGELVQQNLDDFQDYLSDEFAKAGDGYIFYNVISGSFGDAGYSYAWCNGEAFHSCATSLAYMDQAYINSISKRNLRMQYINHPLPRTEYGKNNLDDFSGFFSGFIITFFLIIGVSFLTATFSLFIVKERTDRSTLLQALAGVDPVCFWLSTLLWDYINFVIPFLCIMGIFSSFSITEYAKRPEVVLTLFAWYCFASLPQTYVLSFLFTVPSTSLIRLTTLYMLSGLASIMVTSTLRTLSYQDESYLSSVKYFQGIFLLLPTFCLGSGIIDIHTNDRLMGVCGKSKELKEYCDEKGLTFQDDFLAWDQYGVGKHVYYLKVQGAVALCILFSLVSDIRALVFSCVRQMDCYVESVEVTYDDDDVRNEAKKINNTDLSQLMSSNCLIIQNLRKVYGFAWRKFTAVRSVCITVSEGQCFGLLGINGAGKTTTFRMLTGDLAPTDGTAYVAGHDITKHLRKAQQLMGYCPQFDGLIEQMTGRETVRMYARLRGVPESKIHSCVESLGKILHFHEHLDKECGKYSGGNKRKLSTAIALVGNPELVLLDEPTTGMDPSSRRMLWNVLTAVRGSGRSIVITSHSMEECEALCTKLAIMVNGTLRCIGGPQHLKNKFGKSYIVEVKAKGSAVVSFMENNFPGCERKDVQPGVLTYHVPRYDRSSAEITLAKVFEIMENGKSKAGLGDYTVTQTTLEQVFLNLVRAQSEADQNSG